MTIQIRIPTPLRKFTAGQQAVSVEATTVGEALSELTQAHPELGAKIFGDDGKVRRFINIYANDEDIRFQQQMDTQLGEGDQVSIVPAIAGGNS